MPDAMGCLLWRSVLGRLRPTHANFPELGQFAFAAVRGVAPVALPASKPEPPPRWKVPLAGPPLLKKRPGSTAGGAVEVGPGLGRRATSGGSPGPWPGPAHLPSPHRGAGPGTPAAQPQAGVQRRQQHAEVVADLLRGRGR